MSTVNDNYPKPTTATDEQLKQFAVQQYAQAQARQHNFPTEVINLPSQGKVYPEGNPLASGTVEMKYMTAREEDILTSANLIKQGIVLDKLMESLIVSSVKLDDLIIGDKNAILIASRILGYGKDYDCTVSCPKCNASNKISVDLAQLPEVNISEEANMIAPGIFVYKLPKSGRIVQFRLLTGADDKKISKALEGSKKSNKNSSNVDRELTTRLKHLILSVDDNNEQSYIDNFVDVDLLAMDSRALRTYIKMISPDVKFEINNFSCDECEHVEEALAFSIDSTFFWPKS
jgi:hypothetical protein